MVTVAEQGDDAHFIDIVCRIQWISYYKEAYPLIAEWNSPDFTNALIGTCVTCRVTFCGGYKKCDYWENT
jgi:hypothetical protein